LFLNQDLNERIKGHGRSCDRKAPLTLSATAWRFTCPRFYFTAAPVKNVKTDMIWVPTLRRQLGMAMYDGSYRVWSICANMQ